MSAVRNYFVDKTRSAKLEDKTANVTESRSLVVSPDDNASDWINSWVDDFRVMHKLLDIFLLRFK